MEKNEFKKYAYLIDKNCIKFIYKELFILFFLLVCSGFLLHAVFHSDRNVYYFLNLSISLYYSIPFFIGFLGVCDFTQKTYVIYRRVIASIDFQGELKLKTIFNKNDGLKKFEIILNKENFEFKDRGYLVGFERHYFNYIGIKGNDCFYVIPYEINKKEELVALLKENGCLSLGN